MWLVWATVSGNAIVEVSITLSVVRTTLSSISFLEKNHFGLSATRFGNHCQEPSVSLSLSHTHTHK